MKSYNSQPPSSKSYRFWLAGIFLGAAYILFIVSHVHARWSTFPFEYQEFGSVYTGIWYRNAVHSGKLVPLKIECAYERLSCTKLIIARIFLIMTSITSGIGVICLCMLPSNKNKYKSILYIAGLSLAILSFVFGIIGFLTGLGWVMQSESDNIGSAAICALVGSFLSLISAICAFFINSVKSN